MPGYFQEANQGIFICNKNAGLCYEYAALCNSRLIKLLLNIYVLAVIIIKYLMCINNEEYTMNENQDNLQYYEDEIDLKELVMALWKRKKMIISFTLIAAIIAGIFSMFIITPVYETKLNIVIGMPEIYHTRYGDYTLPIKTNNQYINLIASNDVLTNTIRDMGYQGTSIGDLNRRIDIEKIEAKDDQNSFTVSVSADNPEESLKLAQTLFDSYIEFLDVMIKERAVNYYSDYFNVELNAKQNYLDIENEKVKRNEELLSNTPKVIDGAASNVEIQSHLSEDTDYVIPVDIINPSYIKIENEITQSRQNINETESTMSKYQKYLDELNEENQAINKYYETGREEKLVSNITGVVQSSVYLPSPPIAPDHKSRPSNALNTVVGAVVGCIIGVVAVMIKEYWFKEDAKK